MSKGPDIDVLYHAQDLVGEGPLWDAAGGCLWWVDIKGRAIRRLQPSTGAFTSFDSTEPPAALALYDDGSLIVAVGTGWSRFDPATGAQSPIAQAPVAPGGRRMNDGVVDSAGRFWTGSIDEPTGSGAGGQLFMLDGDRAIRVLDGLLTQNGMAVSPDGRTLYLSDTHVSRRLIWAFDFEVESGALSNRRIFHQCEHGRPDGAAIDSEGCYWFAAIDAGEIVQLDPEGARMASIPLPVTRPTKPAFGGPDLATLYVTTMRNGLDEKELARQPLAGAVLALDPGVRGLPQPFARAPRRNTSK